MVGVEWEGNIECVRRGERRAVVVLWSVEEGTTAGLVDHGEECGDARER